HTHTLNRHMHTLTQNISGQYHIHLSQALGQKDFSFFNDFSLEKGCKNRNAHTHIQDDTHTHTHIQDDTNTHTHKRQHTHTHTHTKTHTHTHTHTHTLQPHPIVNECFPGVFHFLDESR